MVNTGQNFGEIYCRHLQGRIVDYKVEEDEVGGSCCTNGREEERV
jgi:hypothetical protein